MYIYFRKSKKARTSLRTFKSMLLKKVLYVFSVFISGIAAAKEGMWVPATLKAHEKDMQAMGLEIPIEQIYNTDGKSLNNAVVLFGRGCTGELISSRGLVLTNHHCGYGSVQGLSSAAADYFANGFWARNMQEELPCKGLTVTFIRRMENVTDQVIGGIADTLKDAARDSIVNARIAAVEKDFRTRTGLDATIKPYFKGNQYWVAITETYRDIRLVGFPPNGIGAFGGDSENWIWPRHTGDFSLFRVYAGKDNKPADYSSANQPYEPGQFFNLNVGGYKEGDYTMVYGFPGTTNEYISSYELKQVYSILDPIAIEARTRKLGAWTKHMSQSRDIFIKYTSKRAGVANGWKKWQGEVLGLKANDVMKKKRKYQKKINKWARHQDELGYATGLLSKMEAAAAPVDELMVRDQYNKEAVLAIELVQQAAIAEKMLACMRTMQGTALTDTLGKLVASTEGFYKNYDVPTDRDVFVTLMDLYVSKCAAWMPEYYTTQLSKYGTVQKWADAVYGASVFTTQDMLKAFAASAKPADTVVLKGDAAWMLYSAIAQVRKADIEPKLKEYYKQMTYLDRLYVKARMAKDADKDLYPDANLTLRVTYGKVEGLDPEGPAGYSWQTTLDDAMALNDSTVDEFRVPAKLKALYQAKDYGRWGVNGTVPLAFIASNHTSGGNSGSPVLNSKGELIGTNFDRAYEGTMSDYYFDPSRCRNISVDIRYTLFIIEKFGGAGWLLDEMKIVNK